MNIRFSAGTVLSRTFSVWGKNAVAFSAVALLMNTPAFVLTLLAGKPRPGQGSPPLTQLSAILAMILSFAVTGALTYGVLRSLNGETPRIGEIMKTGVRKLWPVLVATLAIGIAVTLWSLLLIVPGIIAFCAYSVAVPAIVAEKDLAIRASFKRSRSLTEGHRFSIFAVLSLFFFMVIVITVPTTVALVQLGLRDVVPYELIALVSQMVSVIMGGLYSTACAVAYHDLRIVKEGVDTAQLVAVFE